MGNKMCKKKGDNLDNTKSTSAFDRIFTRLHLKPNSWKSDSNLNTKRMNRYESSTKNARSNNGSIIKAKSSDWTQNELEVQEKDEVIHLKNPQLSFIFNDDTTPTPPPRKHKKSLREKIETVAKNSIQALQSKKVNEETKVLEEPKLAKEVICIKKTYHYGCPCGNPDSCNHKREDKSEKVTEKLVEKDASRKKNLSTSSLPNYTELKFSIANSDGSNLKYIDSSVSTSANSLPGEVKKSTNAAGGKLENYMTRCRSFGSLLNNKLKTPKAPVDIESDDSFGGLEDWDLGILEHYNPKDASLPRPRKLKTDKDIISDIEKLIVPDEELEIVVPVRPVRRSGSSIKKKKIEQVETPPPSPQLKADDNAPLIPADKYSTHEDDSKVEHSKLMRILQEYSVKDATAHKWNATAKKTNDKTISNVTADFLKVEQQSVS